MEQYESSNGYRPLFLDTQVDLPRLNNMQQLDLSPVKDSDDGVLHYINYSLQLSVSRGFPFFTATNIDAFNFKKAPRKDSWRKDDRIDFKHQWGTELYSALKSDFDKGHMTKREDVQWGDSIAIASKAADSTFFYTNAVPQLSDLNQKIWRSLEDYILHTEARNNGLKICVFTGPVLRNQDPWFVTEVNGRKIQLPILFWKVVVYKDRLGNISRAGFLMSQSSLLFEKGIVQEKITEKFIKEDLADRELFQSFEKAATFQVNIELIEKLTGLALPKAKEAYSDNRVIELILQEVDIKESLKESANIIEQLGYRINGLKL